SVTVDIHGKAYAKAVGEIPTALQLLVDKYQKSSVKPTAIMAELTKAIKE
ncbi:MAG: hypothetical protein HUK19_08300, partial [Fibrobacter sp.]|nr:hypothetical protein [Fibrobacter sp.]